MYYVASRGCGDGVAKRGCGGEISYGNICTGRGKERVMGQVAICQCLGLVDPLSVGGKSQV